MQYSDIIQLVKLLCLWASKDKKQSRKKWLWAPSLACSWHCSETGPKKSLERKDISGVNAWNAVESFYKMYNTPGLMWKKLGRLIWEFFFTIKGMMINLRFIIKWDLAFFFSCVSVHKQNQRDGLMCVQAGTEFLTFCLLWVKWTQNPRACRKHDDERKEAENATHEHLEKVFWQDAMFAVNVNSRDYLRCNSDTVCPYKRLMSALIWVMALYNTQGRKIYRELQENKTVAV